MWKCGEGVVDRTRLSRNEDDISVDSGIDAPSKIPVDTLTIKKLEMI